MFPLIGQKEKVGSIHNHEIIVERMSPKISKKFSTSVNQFNIYLNDQNQSDQIQLNSENIDTLRDILNKFYIYATKIFERQNNSNIYFQMNLTLKG